MRSLKMFMCISLAVIVLAYGNFVCADEDVFFISSEDELATALDRKDTIRGLAIQIDFYNSTTPEKQHKINALVKHIISLKLRPLFLYGQPFDHALAKKLFLEEDGSHCRPTAWVGIFPKSDDPGVMCGADDKPCDEMGFRNWILFFWKNYFLKQP